MYESDNLEMLKCEMLFSESKNILISLSMIEMVVASFAMCEK